MGRLECGDEDEDAGMKSWERVLLYSLLAAGRREESVARHGPHSRHQIDHFMMQK